MGKKVAKAVKRTVNSKSIGIVAGKAKGCLPLTVIG